MISSLIGLLYIIANIIIYVLAYHTACDWYGEEIRRWDALGRVIDFNIVIVIACFVGFIIGRLQ